MENLPWSDLKIAFGTRDALTVWRALESGAGRHVDKLPQGWSLCETDRSGARCVAVFRVSGVPTIEDGLTVKRLISRYRL